MPASYKVDMRMIRKSVAGEVGLILRFMGAWDNGGVRAISHTGHT